MDLQVEVLWVNPQNLRAITATCETGPQPEVLFPPIINSSRIHSVDITLDGNAFSVSVFIELTWEEPVGTTEEDHYEAWVGAVALDEFEEPSSDDLGLVVFLVRYCS